MTLLTNAFSLQMVANLDTSAVIVEKVNPSDVPVDAVSAIGHADCANICSTILNRKVEVNRSSQRLTYGDVVYVAQFVGGRLPEGATSLPEGVELQFFRVSIKSAWIPEECRSCNRLCGPCSATCEMCGRF